MKAARFVIAVLTVLTYLGSLAEYLSNNPHIPLLQAIAVTFGLVVIFSIAYFFILMIAHAIMEC